MDSLERVVYKMQQLLTYMKMKRNRLKGRGKIFNLGL